MLSTRGSSAENFLSTETHSPFWGRSYRIRLLFALPSMQDWPLKLHPKLSKAHWDSSKSMQLSDPQAGFPTGADTSVVLAKWRGDMASSSSLQQPPINVTAWPSDEGGHTVCTIEWDLSQSAQQRQIDWRSVEILIPCAQQPQQFTCSSGSHLYDARERLVFLCPNFCLDVAHFFGQHSTLIWTFDVSTQRGQAELTLPSIIDEDSFFPVRCRFRSQQLWSQLSVSQVESLDSGSAVPHQSVVQFTTDRYEFA